MLVSLHLTCTFAIEYTVLNFILNDSFQDEAGDLDYGPTQGRATIEEYLWLVSRVFKIKPTFWIPLTLLIISVI